MPAAEKNGPESHPTDAPLRSAPGARRLHYRASNAWLLIVVGASLPILLGIASVFGRFAVLLLLVVGIIVLCWQWGITIDTEKRTFVAWSGPFFPLVWTRYRLDWFNAVAVVTDTFEVHHHQNSIADLLRPDPRRYGSEVSLKLVAQLTPETRYPEDLPLPLKIPLSPFRGLFGRKTTLQEEGRKLAEAIGFPFMDVR